MPNHRALLLFAFCGLAALFSMFRGEGELGRILEAWCSAVLTRKAVISNFWKSFLDILNFGGKSDFREGQSNYLNQFRSERIEKSWERFAEVMWLGGLKYLWQLHVVKYEILVYFLCVKLTLSTKNILTFLIKSMKSSALRWEKQTKHSMPNREIWLLKVAVSLSATSSPGCLYLTAPAYKKVQQE